jgi:hypothetical protein
LFGNIGQGGGGGAGGVGKYGGAGTTLNAATKSGNGSYNAADLSVYGLGESPLEDPQTGSDNVKPGTAAGAKAAPLTGLPFVYGRSGMPGIVVVRLTSE